MSEALKPCPFCGQNSLEAAYGSDDDQCVACWGCRSFGPPSVQDPVTRWNTRPIEDTLRARAEAADAKLAAVPWERLLRYARRLAGEYMHQGFASSDLNADIEWLEANRPQETR
jgi:hypothetical protein